MDWKKIRYIAEDRDTHQTVALGSHAGCADKYMGVVIMVDLAENQWRIQDGTKYGGWRSDQDVLENIRRGRARIVRTAVGVVIVDNKTNNLVSY
jgi:hypothetical protein